MPSLTLSSVHKLVLDDLGVRQIAAVVGGSMGGMLVLEYAYFGTEVVRTIVPLATSSRHSAWGISWGEAQRQSIYCDPKYEDGYYSFDDPPSTGLGAARMSALLTYRSRDSFESRFGRNIPGPSRKQGANGNQCPPTPLMNTGPFIMMATSALDRPDPRLVLLHLKLTHHPPRPTVIHFNSRIRNSMELQPSHNLRHQFLSMTASARLPTSPLSHISAIKAKNS